MAIFCQLPFEHFDALLPRSDQPFEIFDVLLERLNRRDGLFESFAQILIGLGHLLQFFVFQTQGFTQGAILSSELL